MKRLVSLVLTVIMIMALMSYVVMAADAYIEEITINEDNHYLMMKKSDGSIVSIVEQYVISYNYDLDKGLLYYVVIENGHVKLYSSTADCKKRNISIAGFDEMSLLDDDSIELMGTPNKSVSELVDAAMTIIYRNEGSYGSVNEDDNGAVSIGKVQWHGNRALNLLKTIVNANPSNALSILGATLYNEIVNSSSWSTRTVNSTESDAISKLLTTAEGKAAQDALAATDIIGT